MKFPTTNNSTSRFPAFLAAPLALTLVLTGCSSPATPSAAAQADFPVFIQAANSPPPALAANRATATELPELPESPESPELPEHGPGLYKLDLGIGSGPAEGKEQYLLCMFHEAPGDVVICKATVPVRWKELDGQHKQANRVVIHRDADADTLEVRADSEDMATIRIMPTEITEEAVISGLYVRVEDNEAHISLDPEEAVGGVLITPDSYEILTESSPALLRDRAEQTEQESRNTPQDFPQDSPQDSSQDAPPRVARVKVT